ncbi:MAG: 2-amino-4-hydroxy-6-hydroxymethyldihydropteridine diphosphokinase [Lachnospiraceae bacterium]|nr:2-amino-4-hydroxy-6-hydroxymethyldihydropteridine diphosphokinase [Lachnospiraceae bacterium]
MDRIRIENLEVYAHHGVFPQETQKGQIFVINAVLYTELRKAAMADELALSTNYGEVCYFIDDYLREHTFLLIEAAAEHLAKELLLHFPLIERMELEIQKPHAPINLPFSSVSVKIERGWKLVYLGIGSNLGDKQAYIQKGIEGLKENPMIRGVKCSEVIATPPYGGVEQDDFLNAAIELKTLLTPYELLDFLHQLEAEAGRERKVHWGPRTLDLDILFYQDFLSNDLVLTVPHPDMENRHFVLAPLNELCPWYSNPVTGKSVRQMYLDLVRGGKKGDRQEEVQ